MEENVKLALAGKSVSFDEFLNSAENKVENTWTGDQDLLDYTKLNIQRMKRIIKTYTPSAEILDAMKRIRDKQTWMVITEDWCGDSAQNLPFISKIADLNGSVSLRIIERDRNLDIMDMYLTSGARSIPKLIAFDKEGNELFQWGARPASAAELMKNMREQGLKKEEMIEKLHFWYAKNKGADLEKEFITLLSK